VNDSWQANLETHLEREGRAFEFCTTTADFRSGVTGFLKKARPEFVGK
jgi:enoyl-CoA hydratase/carnithine racemase